MSGKNHIIFSWIWIFVGVITGMILGTFAFNGPVSLAPELMDYSSLPRRMLRLAHISFFGLALINFMYGATVLLLKIKTSKSVSSFYILGMITMPLILIISAFYESFKYALVLPASLIFLAILFTLRSILMRDKNAI